LGFGLGWREDFGHGVPRLGWMRRRVTRPSIPEENYVASILTPLHANTGSSGLKCAC
jgi:hypothetical protein